MTRMQSRSMQKHGLVLLALLAVQYILGMLSNLFVSFPENNTDWQQWEFAKTQPVIIAHIILGMLILVGTISLHVRAIKEKSKSWRVVSGITFGSILLAIMSGSEFISMQREIYSFAMAIFFIIAVGALVWGLCRNR